MERTFVILKPNAVRRGLVGEILKRFEQRGIKIVGLKFLKMTREQAEKLYEPHKGKQFYDELLEFMLSGPIVAVILEAPRCLELVRHIVGATDPLKAEAGSIRGEFALTVTKNLIHASDSTDNFIRESSIFFSPSEIIDYYLDVQDDI
ncbi:nucleoside-diphosphate kinase [Fervidobacterium nodosum]|uniref:Nucleoside diphosphate kinase n=1 Tax=Fervidobacterium nodosum (strain ATCC 35602 / DSM 5306 / Rt17-B1) TaxID=381764 RepID=NDK_FERNB|nr:nucleoside-diphosphate kinase [Fervidobacterium nodosum]A7HJ26.1 RecName: Full=Nucleoside diphosphate kinase; Short=NDK; Short=NDP kinase; AltName: Full=Nucleoside-2-P kinase [Fervidobacterium nodosum Rt17-B1]ABS59909.1 Nucleoside-diphosphate kinase [Fervidobacterium nodosum Rt17-B1]